jgi:hypothetical protein
LPIVTERVPRTETEDLVVVLGHPNGLSFKGEVATAMATGLISAHVLGGSLGERSCRPDYREAESAHRFGVSRLDQGSVSSGLLHPGLCRSASRCSRSPRCQLERLDRSPRPASHSADWSRRDVLRTSRLAGRLC